MELDDIGYIEDIRQRMGLEEDDKSRDVEILAMTPMERVRLIVGWNHGDGSWADTYKEYFESQGLYFTTNPEADGVIHD